MKKVLIGCAIAFGVFMVVVVVGSFVLMRYVTKMAKTHPGMMKMPPSLNKPTVTTGAGVLVKSVFVSAPSVGNVTDIRYGELDPSPGPEIGFAGTRGVLYVDMKGKAKKTISFGSMGMPDRVNFVDVEGDRVAEYMDRGSWSSAAKLLDHSGNVMWTYGGSSGVDDMAAGDVDGDGKLEFAVGFNGGGGVELADFKGKKRWGQSDGNVWHVEMVDTNGDGRPEIVHSNAGGQITIRDSMGNVLSQSKTQGYFSHFTVSRWPDRTAREYAMLPDTGTIWVLGFNGKSVAKLKASQNGMLGGIYCAPVALVKGKPDYFAAVVPFDNWKRSILYVYDSSQKVVYQEVLGDVCQSIAAVPRGTTGTEMLLVGSEGKILQYVAQKPGP